MMKTKDLNQIMSVLYLGLGYGFIYLRSSWTPEWGADFIYGCLCNRSAGVLLWKLQKTGP